MSAIKWVDIEHNANENRMKMYNALFNTEFDSLCLF